MHDHPDADVHRDARDPGEARPGEASTEGGFDLETVWKLVEEAIPPQGADPFLGTVVGGVRLVRVVGEGGMGRVYEGVQDRPSRTVAVKLQRPGRLERESTRRFLRELEILGGLSHPALCRVFHAGFLPCGGERLPWFVMEFVADAMPISRFAQERKLSLRRRVELFRDVCRAVAAAHAVGVVHRDLKSTNIIVGSDGQPKVIDFGVAAAFRGDLHATSLTHAGRIVGTIESIAPELLADHPPEANPRSDVWSLGVVLHELVTGANPFRIGDGSIIGALERIREHRPALAARASSAAGRAVGGIVDKALAPEAADRHADAGALACDLTALLDRFPDGHGGWDEGGHVTLRPRPARARGRLLSALAATAVSAAAVAWIVAVRTNDGASQRVPFPAAAGVRDASLGEPTPASRPPPLGQPDFRHAVYGVDDPEADRHLVEATGVRKWHEEYGGRYRYWGPERFDVEGRLVYRYQFERPSRRIHLRTTVSARAQSLEMGIIGNGACALEYSTDGREWHAVANHLEPRQWGVEVAFDGFLPDDAVGTTALWLRVRLLSVGPWRKADYALAQFLRHPSEDRTPVFELDVECEPAADAASGGAVGGGSNGPPLSG